MSAFRLLKTRRFAPFFWVQFCGAFNDNLFKNALVILIAFKAATESESGLLINIAAGLFILPFFLFSPIAGQLADKFEKSRLMRLTKLAEIGIMVLGSVSFFVGNNFMLFATLFLMGTQSAFFGPAKYSILPQHLKEDELMAGNSMVELGTFLAILLGTMAGGLLVGVNTEIVSATLLVVALVGYFICRAIPLAPPTEPSLKLNYNLFQEIGALYRIARRKDSVFNSILGISWFWFFGATILAQLPNFTKHVLYGDEAVVTMLLAIFSVSIGVGAIVCEKLSRGEIELGLVPIGAVGVTIFGADLLFIDYPMRTELMSVGQYLNASGFDVWRPLVDLSLIGAFSSFFIVPLYALIQSRSEETERSRVIAANNIFNSVFMVASAIFTVALIQAGLTTVEILFVASLMNLAVSVYIFALIPEFVMRFVTWLLASTIYRLRYEGRNRIPRQGAAVLVCNHVSYIDWFIITAACRRPVRFVMYHKIFKIPVLSYGFKAAKAIPIAPEKEDADLKELAFARIAAELAEGELVCIFPEGGLTRGGELMPFRSGIERILAESQVPVIPMSLNGLWGSFFSREKGRAMSGMPAPRRRQILLRVGEVQSHSTSAERLQDLVGELVDEVEVSVPA